MFVEVGGQTRLGDGEAVLGAFQLGVKEIAELGGSARFIAADLADAEGTLRLASEAGEVDILVNNAGRLGTSKAGIEILARYWATEFGAGGVRVNTVSPGPVKTEGGGAARDRRDQHAAGLRETVREPPGAATGSAGFGRRRRGSATRR
ncbi:SDR family oxidoreductase [Streptomyces sp. Inha503]|uniref:SDR family oxidoreductase n=1 Tax=Streptomyces sp. Inha503 TaxID=3383314 RepID=UPI0039A331C2